MEVKINKEIRNYQETIFFGLSFRQFFCSLLACAMAVILYFSFDNYLNKEVLSWVCILGAVPFGVLGFVKYNGMNAEEFVIAWIKSEILMPKVLFFKPENYYEELLKIEIKEDEEEKKSVISKKKKKRKSKNT